MHPSSNCSAPSLVSINAVGVDIAAFSAMSDEEEVLLLPGLPMVNRVGENPEPDLWTFDVETPGSTVSDGSGRLPSPLIDYVHPGELVWRFESKLREHVHFRPD